MFLGEFAVLTNSRKCVYAKRSHRNNHIYLSVDSKLKIVNLACFNDICKKIIDLQAIPNVDISIFTQIENLFPSEYGSESFDDLLQNIGANDTAHPLFCTDIAVSDMQVPFCSQDWSSQL